MAATDHQPQQDTDRAADDAAAGLSALALAAERGYTRLIKALIRKGADVHAATPADGRTPLHLAALGGSAEAVQALLAAGADVNAADKQQLTPLHLAASQGAVQVVAVLLAAGADVNAVAENATPLLAAAAADHGSAETVELLLAAGARVDAAYSNGKTPLHVAAAKGCVAAVQALLAAGAPVLACKESCDTVLAVAAWEGHAAAVKVLCKHMKAKSAGLLLRGSTAQAAFEYQAAFSAAWLQAIRKGHLGVLGVLLDAKLGQQRIVSLTTGLQHRNEGSVSVLQFAAGLGSAAVVSTLLQHPSSQKLSLQVLLDAAWAGLDMAANRAHMDSIAARWREGQPKVAGLGDALRVPEKLEVVCRLLQAAVERSDAAVVYTAMTENVRARGTTQMDRVGRAPPKLHLLYIAFSQAMLRMQGCLEGELRSQQPLLQQLSVSVAASLPDLQDSYMQAASKAAGVLGSAKATGRGSRGSRTLVGALGDVLLLLALALLVAVLLLRDSVTTVMGLAALVLLKRSGVFGTG